MKKILMIILLLLYAREGDAECYHNGSAYSTGTVVGEYVCSVDGSWQRR